MLQWREATRHLEKLKDTPTRIPSSYFLWIVSFWLLSNELPGCPPRFSRWCASIVSPGYFLGISHENLAEFWPLVTLKPLNPKLLTIISGSWGKTLYLIGFLFMGKTPENLRLEPEKIIQLKRNIIWSKPRYRALKQKCILFAAGVQAWNIGTVSSRKKKHRQNSHTPLKSNMEP